MAKQTYTTGQVLTAAQMTALQANDYNWTVSAKTASYVLVAADAGTRITMSNAGATTITVNTALFTAGDTLTITNIGAGACTITAGTATVSTAGSLVLNQYDSGTLYFSSTSAAIWNGANPGDITGVTAGTGISGGGTSGTVTVTNSMATEITASGDIIVGTGSGTFDNLPIGTTGQILTADTTVSPYKVKWATATGGGSQTLLSTTSLSGTSTTISSIASGYRALYIYGRDIKVTSGTAYLRLRWNGFTAGYYGNAAIAGAFSTYQSVRFANAGGVQDDNAARTSLDNSQNCQFYINFPEYTATGFKLGTGWFNPSYSEDVMTFAVLNDGSQAALSSFTVTTSAGTASMAGTIYVYGVN